ncbi:hydroxypyruvate isomerase family protein [Gluconacetobacter azotocaptans]|uniref:Hydroxypyruvate isomerase family protein n=1 Tax=Gluconacetobacter azotocaptans TaxID=142834 RepID=A0A7W4JQ21_9PROT|nr:2-oxo-tetronate isomerase [Gluconacetobacter azotocaptans]MBB2188778.1 hydroxypyruvate isomerase family protein [Gluconacetobacter azotocaptans]MBM9403777.1 hydroxypyruvate isomerase family protein [Gluconacetobacter azotocaptans]GBQ28805.1 hydroxypyruvate isomerase [Gluconacetobacter azotocaptans DSM 13594]
MPAFAANLTMNYVECDFLDRFAAAAADGFRGVEFLFPYAHSASEIRARLRDNDLVMALFNAPPGDWAAGERGLAALPGRQDAFRRSIETALAYAAVLGNRRLHVMAGLCPDENTRDRYRDVYVDNIAHAARQARDAGVTIVLEAINTRDMPGYFLTRQEDAAAVCTAIGAENVQVQFDLYHAQIMQGDVATRLRALMPVIGHIQAAGVPDRHEPDDGELAYPYLFRLLDTLGYAGWIGCEYRPRGTMRAGLGWIEPWRGRSAPSP